MMMAGSDDGASGDQDAFTTEQLRLLVTCNRVAASISLISSLIIMKLAFRERHRVFHRLMLATSVHSTLYALWHIVGPAAIPADTPNTWGARGTTASCDAQGFGLQLSFCAPFYYAALSVYSFVAVCNNFQVSKYAWVEKYIHIGVHIFPLGSAIYLLMIEAYNSNGNGASCWIASIPIDCGEGSEIKCERGPQNIAKISFIFATFPGLCSVLVPLGAMIGLYVEVRRNQDRIRLAASSVAKQASLYLGALFCSSIFSFINNSLRWVQNRYFFPTTLLSTTMLTLFFFWVLLMYLCFRVKIGPDQIANPSESPKPDDDERQRNNAQELQTFNIFDGTNATGTLAEFVFDGDSEDEAADREETERWQEIQDHV